MMLKSVKEIPNAQVEYWGCAASLMSVGSLVFAVLLMGGCTRQKVKPIPDVGRSDAPATLQPVGKIPPSSLPMRNLGSVGKLQKARLQAKWQKKFRVLFAGMDADVSRAVGLFSYGGWSNDGQILVFLRQNESGVLMTAKPGSKEVDLKKNLPKGELVEFLGVLQKSSKLKDLETSVMDGLQYEYVEVIRDGSGVVTTINRIYMNNPGIGKAAPMHSALVKSFFSLGR